MASIEVGDLTENYAYDDEDKLSTVKISGVTQKSYGYDSAGRTTTGRFLTRDPIKDGRNWYGYCENNPITRVDPNGKAWHDPSKVYVDPDFDGKVWVVGEMGRGKPQIMRPVPRGGWSPNGMDVDILIVQYPNGSQRRFFIPGTSVPGGDDVPSRYIVDKNGNVTLDERDRPGVMVQTGAAGGVISWAPAVFVPIRGPVDPKEFDPGDRTVQYPSGLGGGPTRNWNDDIDRAKGQGDSRA